MTFNERHGETTQRRIVSEAGAGNPSPDNHDVKRPVLKGLWLASHRQERQDAVPLASTKQNHDGVYSTLCLY